jgi:hypothetical protein
MEMHRARLNKLSLNAGWVSGVDPLNESARETVLDAEEDTDHLHTIVLRALCGTQQARHRTQARQQRTSGCNECCAV